VKLIAQHDGEQFPVEVERHAGGYRVKLGDRWLDVDLVNAGPYVRSVRLGNGAQFAVIHHRNGSMHEVTLADSTIHVELHDPLALRRRRSEDETSGGGVVKALMPGRIMRVLVAKGDRVAKGAGLLILEAMKMENEIQSPADGIVDAVHVEPGQTVDAGAELVHVESAE
jgi:biotin carboxyl carrier protein